LDVSVFLTQTDGEVFREVLVALSDAERSDGDLCYVEWSSRFEIDPQYEARLVDLMNQNFLVGLRNLAEKFGGNPATSP